MITLTSVAFPLFCVCQADEQARKGRVRIQTSSAASFVNNGLAMTVEQSTVAMETAKKEYLANKELLRLQKELEIIQGATLPRPTRLPTTLSL